MDMVLLGNNCVVKKRRPKVTFSHLAMKCPGSRLVPRCAACLPKYSYFHAKYCVRRTPTHTQTQRAS